LDDELARLELLELEVFSTKEKNSAAPSRPWRVPAKGLAEGPCKVQFTSSVRLDFVPTTNVINGCSELIVELYGLEAGTHARMAPGMATLPSGLPVTIAAEVAISS
jgi:hypothetical protein